MAANIYDHISSNKKKTYLIVFGFIAFITFLGYIIGLISGGQTYGVPIMTFAFLFSGFSSFFSYYFSDKMVLAIAGAKKIKKEELPKLYGMVENLCIGAGVKKIPGLYVIEDTAPNAFATGRDPDHSSIAITSGLLQKLDKRELEGVLAHELSHIKNYDIRLMTITAILVGTVTLVANILLHSNFGGNRNNKGAGGIILVGFVLALLSPIIAELIKLAVSRSREYLADASASLITRDPEALANALKKISSDKEALEVANEATAHMYISNPLKKNINSDFFANLFNTHPPVHERIKRLESM